MKTCRFAQDPGHCCARRDGRACAPDECHVEARAQLADLAHISAEVDAALPLAWLLGRRSEWEVTAP